MDVTGKLVYEGDLEGAEDLDKLLTSSGEFQTFEQISDGSGIFKLDS